MQRSRYSESQSSYLYCNKKLKKLKGRYGKGDDENICDRRGRRNSDQNVAIVIKMIKVSWLNL